MQPKGFGALLLIGILAIAATGFYLALQAIPSLLAFPDWTATTTPASTTALVATTTQR